MASKQKRRLNIKQVLREWDVLSTQMRATMAGRTAGEVLYDDAVVTLVLAGLPVEDAVRGANQLYPSEALEVSPDTIDDLENHYGWLKRIYFVDYLPHASATPPPNQANA